MPSDGDPTDRILRGSAYERAAVTVRRTFPFTIAQRIRIAVGVLAVSGLLAPVLYVSRGRIRSFGGTETLSLTIVTLALLGVVTTAAAGLVLVAQLHRINRGSLGDAEARRLVRTEDVVMWFVLQGGTFVFIPVTLAVVGLISADTVETLYGYDVVVYQPSVAVPVSAPWVSGFGGCCSAVLYGLYRTLGG